MPDFGHDNLVFTGAGAATVAQLGDSIATEQNADVVNVFITAGTAPTGSSLIVDILNSGTSIWATAIGTVGAYGTAQSTSGGVSNFTSSSTSLIFVPNDDQGPGLKVGQYITIGTEQLLVSAVTGSSEVIGAVGEYIVTVVRAQNGTSAAAAAYGVSVYQTKPFLPVSALSEVVPVVAPYVAPNTPPLLAGSILTATVLQVGSTVAGSNVQVEVELDLR